MKSSEFGSILVAIIILTAITSLTFIINYQLEKIPMVFLFSVIIIIASILSKKITANLLDSDVEHEIWQMQRYGFYPRSQFKNPIPAGIIFPIIFSIISLGMLKFSALLTYETRALKYRASKRFGYYSFTEMTEWHNGLIGAVGIFFILILAIISYFLPIAELEYFAKMSIYYAFWNLLPISKLDGAQIFFGSRILWTILATITAILTFLTLVTI